MSLSPLNWWRGSLRPYESGGSFIAHFCRLNSISPSICLDFFGNEFKRFALEGKSVSNDEIQRIALLLDEPLEVVDSVCNPTLSLSDAGVYKVRPPERIGRWSVFICRDCAKLGFHSYLHELVWVKFCPFHGLPLQQESRLEIRAKSKFDNYIASLSSTFREYCDRWPVSGGGPLNGLTSRSQFARFQRWARSARQHGVALSSAVFWTYPDVEQSIQASAAQNIGRLLTLVPGTTEIQEMLLPVARWTLYNWQFDTATKSAIQNLLADIDIDSVINLYVNTGLQQTVCPPFFAMRDSAVGNLLAGHKRCRCRWELVYGSFYTSAWIPSAEDKMHTPIICPLSYVISELLESWELQPRSPKRRWEFSREIYNTALILQKHGLITVQYSLQDFVAASQVKDSSAMNGLRWNAGHIMAPFLNILAEARFSAILADAYQWLDKIEQGFAPSPFPISSHSVYLDGDEHWTRLFAWNLARDNEQYRNA